MVTANLRPKLSKMCGVVRGCPATFAYDSVFDADTQRVNNTPVLGTSRILFN